jgi:hypothetical protein
MERARKNESRPLHAQSRDEMCEKFTPKIQKLIQVPKY